MRKALRADRYYFEGGVLQLQLGDLLLERALRVHLGVHLAAHARQLIADEVHRQRHLLRALLRLCCTS